MTETALAARRARGDGGQFRRRGILAFVMTAFVAVGGVIAAPIAAQAAEEPSIMVGVTEVANERVVFAIEGTGFGDIQALPGQTEPHAYF
ncbi:hypothetical protein, partial [Microbacterium gubbeenense]